MLAVLPAAEPPASGDFTKLALSRYPINLVLFTVNIYTSFSTRKKKEKRYPQAEELDDPPGVRVGALEVRVVLPGRSRQTCACRKLT